MYVDLEFKCLHKFTSSCQPNVMHLGSSFQSLGSLCFSFLHLHTDARHSIPRTDRRKHFSLVPASGSCSYHQQTRPLLVCACVCACEHAHANTEFPVGCLWTIDFTYLKQWAYESSPSLPESVDLPHYLSSPSVLACSAQDVPGRSLTSVMSLLPTPLPGHCPFLEKSC